MQKLLDVHSNEVSESSERRIAEKVTPNYNIVAISQARNHAFIYEMECAE